MRERRSCGAATTVCFTGGASGDGNCEVTHGGVLRAREREAEGVNEKKGKQVGVLTRCTGRGAATIGVRAPRGDAALRAVGHHGSVVFKSTESVDSVS